MKNQTVTLEHASVRQYCKSVRVPTIGVNFVSLSEQAIKENHSHIRCRSHAGLVPRTPWPAMLPDNECDYGFP